MKGGRKKADKGKIRKRERKEERERRGENEQQPKS